METVAAAACRYEERVGRREATRHAVNLSARLVSAEANVRVQLDDLSASGACIRLMQPHSFAAGNLRWLDFSSFAQVVWRGELRCGLAFADPLDATILARTLEFAELVGPDTGDKFGRLASAWVHGPGDW